MEMRISTLDVEDAEDIVRKVDLPAIQDGPLYRLMFPSVTTIEQENEIVQWYAKGLAGAIHHDHSIILQICNVEGMPMGFCGWTWEDRTLTAKEDRVSKSRKLLVPGTLDVRAWLSVSSDLKKERERVLNGRGIVCREYQP